eukprot:3750616-Rhodomonas_salina.1
MSVPKPDLRLTRASTSRWTRGKSVSSVAAQGSACGRLDGARRIRLAVHWRRADARPRASNTTAISA